jgi:DNA-binding NarL/FixJ family response regulator
MTQKKVSRVLIVENLNIVRECLCMLLSRRRDIEIVGQASTAAEAVAKAAELKPDVVVIDTHLPDQSGIEASRNIRARFPEIRVLLLTAHGDDRAILGSVLAGASGYLNREVRCAETLDTIRKVAIGHALLDTTVIRKVLARISTTNEEHSERRLTESEKRILDLVADGRNNPEIASEVLLSESTVQETIMMIHGKLEINRRSQSSSWRTRRETKQATTPAKA